MTVEYEDFDLHIDAAQNGAYAVSVLKSPAGEGRGVFHPPFVGEETESGGKEGAVRDVLFSEEELQAPAASGRERGDRLFRALFTDEIRDLFVTSLNDVSKVPGRGLRIKIRLSPKASGFHRLDRLPWELLYFADRHSFLAQSRITPVVRYLDAPQAPVPPQQRPSPLRVLLVLASPRDLPPLQLAREVERLARTLAEIRGVEVVQLEQADPARLRAALLAQPIHVLHFMGHGTFDESSGRGKVFFQDPEGYSLPVDAEALATELRGIPSLRLVFLNACQTARAGDDPFSGLASALLLGGVPAVLAMRAPIPDRAAPTFSGAFYSRLAAGDPIETALTEGRLALRRELADSEHWATPALFTRMADGNLFAPAKRPAETSTVWRRGRIVLLAAAGLGVAVLVALPRLDELRCGPLGSTPPGVQRVFVENFENLLITDKDQGEVWTRETRDALYEKLRLVKGLQPVGQSSVKGFERAGACLDLTVGGSLRNLEGGVQLTATVHRRSGEDLEPVRVATLPDPSGETLSAAQSELALQIAAKLGIPLDAETERRITELPTKSLQALELNNRGVAEWLKGDKQAAGELFRRALREDPRYSSAHSNLGLLELHGNPGKAERHFAAALQRTPENPTYLFNLGLAQDYQRRYETAARSYRKAIELDPVFSRAYNNLGLVELKLGRPAAAEEHLREGLFWTQDSALKARIYKNLGRAALCQGRAREAVEMFDQALAKREFLIPAQESEALFFLALSLEEQGEREEANVVWKRYEPVARRAGTFHPRPGPGREPVPNGCTEPEEQRP